MSELVDACAARIYDALKPYQDTDGDDTVLLGMCAAAAAVLARPVEALRHDEFGTGGRRMHDPDRAPAWALPWLAQHVSIATLPSSLTEAQQRAMIRDAPGMRRGTPASMVAAAAPYLTGNKTVVLIERDGGPYKLTVVTRTSETPDSTTVLNALTAAKPAGIDLTYTVADGQVWDEVTTHWDDVPAGVTWTDAATTTI